MDRCGLQDLFLSLFIFRSTVKPFYYETLKFLRHVKALKILQNLQSGM